MPEKDQLPEKNDDKFPEKIIKSDSSELIDDNPQNKIKQKGIAQGFFSLISLNLFLFIGNIVISLIVPLFLHLPQVGIYREIYQYLPLISVFVLFGMVNTSTKYITMYDSKNEKSKSAAIVYYVLLVNSGIGIVFLILFFEISPQLSLFITGTSQYGNLIRLLSIQFLFIPISVLNQFFIVRFKFKNYLIGNIIGNLLSMSVMIFLLIRTHNITSYFYSAIFGQLFTFIYLLIYVLILYKKPDFSVSFLEILKYSLPLLLNDFLIYIKLYIYNIIFIKFVANITALMALLSYIITFFNALNVTFNSLSGVLTVYYSTILYKKNHEDEYKQTTFQISRLFQIISLFISFGYMVLSPLFIRFVTDIYKYPSLFATGTITSILFGIYFFISTFYYISPTIITIHKKSYPLLLMHGIASVVYLVGYFVFIPSLGMIGIPIALSMGFSSFIILCFLDISWSFKIKKRFDRFFLRKIIIYSIPIILLNIFSFIYLGLIIGTIILSISIVLIFFFMYNITAYRRLHIGFDGKMFKKILIMSVPIILCIPFLYLYCKNDTSKLLINLGIYQFNLAINSVIVNFIVLVISMVYLIIFIRIFHLFKQSDKKLFTQFLGAKFGRIIATVLISKSNRDTHSPNINLQ